MKKSKKSDQKSLSIFIVIIFLVVALLGISFFWKTNQKMEPQLQSEYSKTETVSAFSPDGSDPFPGYSITFPASWSYSSEVITPDHPSAFPSQVTTLTKADERIVIERAAFGGHDCQNFEDQLMLEPKLLNGLNLKIHKSVVEDAMSAFQVCELVSNQDSGQNFQYSTLTTVGKIQLQASAESVAELDPEIISILQSIQVRSE